ncbi:MAG TPA: thymidylate synthase [Macellibacteroides fermentans]|uniref:thymidylate synthase n=1 Tax=Macellibacteroides fermentans TaxID=879969 RepID=UPI002B6DB7D7|nr:thymidylate synthase [Macellibacteroides fermentans]
MFTAEYNGINSFLVGAAKLLLEQGVKRGVRGKVCYELPEPFMFKITNPKARWITIPERKWNVALAYAESLWLASGRNDLEMIGRYLFRMKDFSDDSISMRGGYGPRLRKYNGNSNDYKIDSSLQNQNKPCFNEIDQFKFVIQCFNKDINTRQGIITIGDPTKDCFEKSGKLKQTKDFPCTRSLHFMKHPAENKLNLTVYMRSNDILWGASAVNIFNFTFIQEYFAHIMDLQVGDYYHIVNNFHFYEDKRTEIEIISNVNNYIDESYDYKYSFNSLEEFDSKLLRLMEEEFKLINDNETIFDFNDEFFNDWYKVFYCFNNKKKIEFENPILNQIFNF